MGRCWTNSPPSTWPGSTPPTSPTRELLDGLPLLQTRLNRLTALLTRSSVPATARDAHRADGMVTMKTWLTGHCRIAGRDAADLLRDGRRLSDLPQLAAAYAAGAVTPAHVEVITAAVTPARVAVAAKPTASTWPPPTPSSPTRPGLGPEDTAKPSAAGSPASTPTARWTTPPACPGLPDGRLRRAAGSTSPGTSTRSAANTCTPRSRR